MSKDHAERVAKFVSWCSIDAIPSRIVGSEGFSGITAQRWLGVAMDACKLSPSVQAIVREALLGCPEGQAVRAALSIMSKRKDVAPDALKTAYDVIPGLGRYAPASSRGGNRARRRSVNVNARPAAPPPRADARASVVARNGLLVPLAATDLPARARADAARNHRAPGGWP